jgi:hypothetical protein
MRVVQSRLRTPGREQEGNTPRKIGRRQVVVVLKSPTKFKFPPATGEVGGAPGGETRRAEN